MKKVIYALIMFLSIITFAKASELRFEESDNLPNSSIFMTCAQDDSKAYCFSYGSYTQTNGTIYEIDLPTTTANEIKPINGDYTYTSLTKVGNKYIAGGFNQASHSIGVSILDNNFNVIKSEVINSRAAFSSFSVIKINNDYYLLNQAINLYSDYVATRVSSNLETIEQVTLDDLTGTEYEIIKTYAEVNAILNPSGRIERLINGIKAFNGGFIIEHARITGIYSSIIFYKDKEIKWEKEEGGSFGDLILKDDHIYILSEHTNDFETYIYELSNTGEILFKYPITLINEQKRFFLGNYNLAEYNNCYYFFTYNPVDVEDFTTWNNWRITKLSISNSITNKNPESLNVAKEAFANDEVTISINKDYENKIDKIIVKDSNGHEINVKDNKFTMPDSNVTIEATYKEEKEESNNYSNPETSDLIITILFITIIAFSSLIITYFTRHNILEK